MLMNYPKDRRDVGFENAGEFIVICWQISDGGTRIMKFDMPYVYQASQVLCWEACARMMWMWKYESSPDERYTRVVDQFAKVNAGMDWNSLNQNIFVPLGIEGKPNATPANLQQQLQFSPVTITLPFVPSRPAVNLGKGSGHAVIILELNSATQEYLVVDPMTVIVPGKPMSRGHALKLFARTVDAKIGHYIWYWSSGRYC
jgi:hypothetical protein